MCSNKSRGHREHRLDMKENGRVVARGSKVVGKGKGMTTNVAEYMALICALSDVKALGLEYANIFVKSDSQLIVYQINGKYRTQTKKSKDALERLSKGGAEVRLHPMLHARMFCVPKRNFIIIGSGDLQTDCFGGNRFDAGIWSNYPDLIKNAMDFFNRVWDEAKPLSDA